MYLFLGVSAESDEDSKDGRSSGGRKRDLNKSDEKQRSQVPVAGRSRSPMKAGSIFKDYSLSDRVYPYHSFHAHEIEYCIPQHCQIRFISRFWTLGNFTAIDFRGFCCYTRKLVFTLDEIVCSLQFGCR